ncbi:MAG: hypothetical protein PHW83_10145 [Bacteroidales bacterium]|nr:hypothetical protein [Bacteroidales bacterium]
MNQLNNFGIIPFTRGALTQMLREYSSPNDKISSWLANGDIISLKKGLYIVSEQYRTEKLNLEIIANQIYGPSYVSLDSALQFYGIIPEKVSVVTSVCTKRSKSFENEIGIFSYYGVKEQYAGIGVDTKSKDGKHYFLIATIEKALCDKIIFTKNLQLKSLKAVHRFLEDDLRADFSGKEKFNLNIIKQCAECGIKSRELTLLEKYLQNLK